MQPGRQVARRRARAELYGEGRAACGSIARQDFIQRRLSRGLALTQSDDPVEKDDRRRSRDRTPRRNCASPIVLDPAGMLKRILIGIGLAEFNEFGEALSREFCCHEGKSLLIVASAQLRSARGFSPLGGLSRIALQPLQTFRHRDLAGMHRAVDQQSDQERADGLLTEPERRHINSPRQAVVAELSQLSVNGRIDGRAY